MFRKVMLLILPLILFTGCSKETGEMVFKANGEEFIARGFVSKEGWALSFDKVLVSLNAIEAYSPVEENLSVRLEDPFFVDLTDSEGESTEVHVFSAANVPAGNYQSLKFSLGRVKSGTYEGSSVILIGTARKDQTTIPFIIELTEELTFDGREGYVGDSVKGIVRSGGTSNVEMTFHFDHIFGDFESDPEDHVNSKSPGFALFLDYEKEGAIHVKQDEMREHESYPLLMGAIESLGHLGEGHCEVIR